MTLEEMYNIALGRFAQGSAVVDTKFNEVFRFSIDCDARVVVEHPAMFRKATVEESDRLKASGENQVAL